MTGEQAAYVRYCQGCGVEPAEVTHMCQGLLVPGTAANVRLDATVPVEAFDWTHPDHSEWVGDTGRCLATECPQHGS